MIEELLKDIFIIKVPLPDNPLKNINCYLIKGRKRNLLIDTAFNMDICYEALKSGLDKLNVDMQNTDIFITHQHSDHAGLATSIAADGSRIYMSEIDKKGYNNLLKAEYWDFINDEFITYGFSQKELDENKSKNPMSTYLSSKRAEIIGIHENFEFDLGNYKFKSIYTPGHTPGHMCLYDEEHKILFGGDHIIFDISPNITSWMGTDNSLGLYFESLNKIKKMDIQYTFSAHRQAVGNCIERADELIHHHEDRVKEAYEIVKNTKGITTYDVASKMTWSIRAKDWNEFPISQKWFAVGEASAHLEYLFFEGAIIKELRQGKYFYRTVS